MLMTKLRLSPTDNIVTSTAAKRGVKISVLRCSPNTGGGGRGLLRLETDDQVTDETIAEWFINIDGLHVDSCISVSPGRHLLIIDNKKCRMCTILADSGCFLESGSSTESGSLLWNLYFPHQNSLKALIDKIRSDGCKVELLSVKKVSSEVELTKQQNAIICMAFTHGYYDIPKKITLDELSTRCDISKSTLNIILRRAQKKIFTVQLGMGGEPPF